MNDNKTPLPPPAGHPAPCGLDLDDWLFQDEGWLISDRCAER